MIQKLPAGPVRYAVMLAAAGMLLSGCATDTPGPSDGGVDKPQTLPADKNTGNNTPAPSQDTAVLKVDGREFLFELTQCSKYDQEFLFSGPGKEVGTDVLGYISGDLTSFETGEVRVDIGTDQKFKSMDDFLAIGPATGGTVKTTPDASGHTISGETINGKGESVGEGSVKISC